MPSSEEQKNTFSLTTQKEDREKKKESGTKIALPLLYPADLFATLELQDLSHDVREIYIEFVDLRILRL